ncbi:MAG: hypothetical protein WAU01_05295 [Saprospiraceae bacterium]
MTFEMTAQKTFLPNADSVYTFQWDKIADLPSQIPGQPNLGLAGPIAGIIDNQLFIAGGANFPDSPPWVGGLKKYHDKIYILKKSKPNHYVWSDMITDHLPEPVAYASVVSIPQGLVSIGGENDRGCTKSVRLFKIKKNKLKVKNFPDLPLPITSSGAVVIKKKIFVAGGISDDRPLNILFSLDVSKKEMEWVELDTMPVALSHAVVVVQNDGVEDCIYVIGGRHRCPGQDFTTFSDKIFIYSPSKKSWKMTDMITSDGQKIKLAAGTGVPFGCDEIVIFGGDQGDIYHKIEDFNNKLASPDYPNKEVLLQDKVKLLTSHPGFCRDIFVYNTVSGICNKVGEIPAYAQVTTLAFYWEKEIVIPNGEIKPGIRTPALMSIKMSK